MPIAEASHVLVGGQWMAVMNPLSVKGGVEFDTTTGFRVFLKDETVQGWRSFQRTPQARPAINTPWD